MPLAEAVEAGAHRANVAVHALAHANAVAVEDAPAQVKDGAQMGAMAVQ